MKGIQENNNDSMPFVKHVPVTLHIQNLLLTEVYLFWIGQFLNALAS